GDGLLASPQFGLGTRFAFLHPLVHLDLASNRHGAVGGNPEFWIGRNAAWRQLAGDVDELSLVRGCDLFGTDRDHHARAFSQRTIGLDRAALVPYQRPYGGDDQNNADDSANQCILQPRKPRCPRRFREAHVTTALQQSEYAYP